MPGLNEYRYVDGGELEVTDGMKADFDRDGFIVVKGLLNTQELDILKECVQGPDSVSSPQLSYGRDDGEQKRTKTCLWNRAGVDTTGTFSRMRKLAGTAEKLLGGEVYHYHSKLIMKDAFTGGKYVWHQDYGYWYKFGCVFPDMCTAWVALDQCDRNNGCLQVLRGSNRCGRIDHLQRFGQTGADVDRVAELEKVLDKVYVELDAGDALFFHCNVLHTSAQNTSDRRRWALLSCYNRAHNSPFDNGMRKHSTYEPLTKVANDAVIKQGVNRDLQGKDIVNALLLPRHG